ncbi:MAG: nuclear transport factor 2 family protein [Lysobacteraceae bacterium]|jgi:ketosteroid isomerase-like protein|uniref:YybH family protein n=1 Tax=Silanimonas sp. TaxID=1929290 RepID=UPI001BBF8DBA|nr:nuclear transport factor 2 family protein [Silanimonas sp.]MBS3958110.1 nuclear transport factor 2 family protein [Xanthomonadaceae bacterium]MCZ8167357.1 nuclear transport factor 2 family protein [Silanimonas sp.]
MHTFTRSAGVLMLAAAPILATAHENAPHAPAALATARAQHVAPAASTPEATVEAFAQALRRGDTATLRSLLAPDVLILEGGGAERSAEEYLGGHAVSDAAFLKDAHIQQTARTVKTEGNLAWVATESELHVERDGQPVTLSSAETMLLQKIDGAWRIVHIHWSSARRAQKATP